MALKVGGSNTVDVRYRRDSIAGQLRMCVKCSLCIGGRAN